MTRPRAVRLRRAIPFVAMVAVLGLAPLAVGFSGGICVGCEGGAAAPAGDFDIIGCVACHGADHAFTPTPAGALTWTIKDEEGNAPAGNVYEHDAVYTIDILFNESVNPEASSRAGFNLRVSDGELEGVEGQTQVGANGLQATHVNPSRSSWQVRWTAPAAGAVVFDLFVNDADGSGLPDAGDQVHRVGWYLLDEEHALPGAVEEHEVHFGISLQQYWIGLIGLAGMIIVMVAGFGYLKLVNRHNTDAKDR